jgi:hypothetical protein
LHGAFILNYELRFLKPDAENRGCNYQGH